METDLQVGNYLNRLEKIYKNKQTLTATSTLLEEKSNTASI